MYHNFCEDAQWVAFESHVYSSPPRFFNRHGVFVVPFSLLSLHSCLQVSWTIKFISYVIELNSIAFHSMQSSGTGVLRDYLPNPSSLMMSRWITSKLKRGIFLLIVRFSDDAITCPAKHDLMLRPTSRFPTSTRWEFPRGGAEEDLFPLQSCPQQLRLLHRSSFVDVV